MPESKGFQQSMKAYDQAFTSIGGVAWAPGGPPDSLPLIYFMTTGGTEQTLLDYRQSRQALVGQEPVMVVAHPAHNSLAASLEVLARVQQEGDNGQVLYLKGPEDSVGLKKIKDVLADERVSLALRQTRIGLIGVPSDWLVASSPDAQVLQQNWGPRVVQVALSELEDFIQGVPDSAVPEIRKALISGATEVREPTVEEMDDVIKVYLALKQVVAKYDLDALTVRCFDLVLGMRTTGCFGLSQLIDEGHIAGCEGDLVSTMGLLWVQKLLGKTPWMANPAQIDSTSNTLWLAHCTVPRSMVQEYGLRSHFESGLGVGIQGTLAKGPVTLLRIGGVDMKQLWLAEGNITQSGKAEDLCRTQVEIKVSTGKVNELLERPRGNHLVMVQGHHQARLEGWWRQMIVS